MLQDILLLILTIISIVITSLLIYVGYKIYKIFFTPDMIEFFKNQIKSFDPKKFKKDIDEMKHTIYRQMKRPKDY
jgi:hypothetical protein